MIEFDFKSVLNSINTGVLTRNAKGRVLEMNAAAEKILGIRQEQSLLLSLESLLPRIRDEQGDPVSETDYPYVQSLATGRIVQDKLIQFQSDKGRIWINLTTIPHFSRTGKEPDGVLSIFQDITERKEAKAKFLESERFTRLVIDNIPQFIFWKDTESNYLGCNRNFANAAGIDRVEDIAGKTDYDFPWEKEEADGYRRDDREVMDAGRPLYHIRETQLNAEGKKTWLDTNKIPLYDTEGDLKGILGTFEDISERVKSEEELQRLRNYLSDIINAMPSALIGVDRAFRVKLWNTGAEALSGIKKEEALSKAFDSLSPWFAQQKSSVERVFASGESILREKQSRYKRDCQCYEDITFFPIREGDRVESVIIRIDDVSDQVRLQEQLFHSQKMDAIGRLSGGMAHDFNNLLGGIFGAADLLKDFMAGDERSRQFLDIIVTSAERARDLVSKLLVFSRAETDFGSIVNLHSVIRDSEAILQNTLDKRINLVTDLKAENCSLKGDASQLQNIFLNLGINASHAMPDGGTLSYVTENLGLDEAYCSASSFDIEPGDYIVIGVSDTGCGIPPELLGRIFDPFFTTKEPGQGTGLGLSTVYGLVKKLGGAISVYSEPDRGTSFMIHLPVTRDGAAPVMKSSVPLKGAGTVLVIDDEEILRRTSRSILESLGYEVLLAENGQKGIDLFSKNRDTVDLILLDMIMPEMDGMECFERVRHIRDDVPIVVASGFIHEDDIRKLKDKGLNDFIQKPYTRFTLSKVLSRTVKKEDAGEF